MMSRNDVREAVERLVNLQLDDLNIHSKAFYTSDKSRYKVTTGRVAFNCNLKLEELENGQAFLHLLDVLESGFTKSIVIENHEIDAVKTFLQKN